MFEIKRLVLTPVYQHVQIIVSCVKLVGTYPKHLSQSKLKLKNPTAQAQGGRAVVKQIQSPKLGSLSTAHQTLTQPRTSSDLEQAAH